MQCSLVTILKMGIVPICYYSNRELLRSKKEEEKTKKKEITKKSPEKKEENLLFVCTFFFFFLVLFCFVLFCYVLLSLQSLLEDLRVYCELIEVLAAISAVQSFRVTTTTDSLVNEAHTGWKGLQSD